jgi:CheY-like chemotaxis protein
MSGLREELGTMRCSTAIAFDGRQALDLIPMVKPQVVLVDLNLPRGDGLRVASQICSNPETANDISVAMFWTKPIDPTVFRQQAIYSMRDFSWKADDLTRRVATALVHRNDRREETEKTTGGSSQRHASAGR